MSGVIERDDEYEVIKDLINAVKTIALAKIDGSALSIDSLWDIIVSTSILSIDHPQFAPFVAIINQYRLSISASRTKSLNVIIDSFNNGILPFFLLFINSSIALKIHKQMFIAETEPIIRISYEILKIHKYFQPIPKEIIIE